jgi:predicted alpha/beta-hydrolase family hydrolase
MYLEERGKRMAASMLVLAGLAAILLLVLTACEDAAAPTPPPTEPPPQPTAAATSDEPVICPPLPELEPVENPVEVVPQPVTFQTADGAMTLYGTLYGQAPTGIVLSHMGIPGTDQTSWQPFAETLAARGYMALTYDSPGYGQTEGPASGDGVLQGLEAAVAFMREQGAEQLILIGASMGGTESARLASANESGDIIGLGVVSSALGVGLPPSPPVLTDEELAAITMPSLWITGRGDLAYWEMEQMYAAATGPDKELCIYQGVGAHGTDLFDDTRYGDDFEQRLIVFVERAAASAE